MKKVPLVTYRWIEYELYNLENSKKELKLLKEEILACFPDRFGGGNVSGIISDQTGNKVIKLMTNPRVNNLERKIKAIERVLKRRKVFRDIYRFKYKENLSIEECCRRMGIESKGIFRFLREALISQIARELGENGGRNFR